MNEINVFTKWSIKAWKEVNIPKTKNEISLPHIDRAKWTERWLDESLTARLKSLIFFHSSPLLKVVWLSQHIHRPASFSLEKTKKDNEPEIWGAQSVNFDQY